MLQLRIFVGFVEIHRSSLESLELEVRNKNFFESTFFESWPEAGNCPEAFGAHFHQVSCLRKSPDPFFGSCLQEEEFLQTSSETFGGCAQDTELEAIQIDLEERFLCYYYDFLIILCGLESCLMTCSRARYVPRLISHGDLWVVAANVAIKVSSAWYRVCCEFMGLNMSFYAVFP